jgi:hypothetical protein
VRHVESTGSTGGAPYALYYTRDAPRPRAPARAPVAGRREGVAFLAPIDAEAGGTWLAVSERGLTLCLLNGFPAPGQAEPPEAPSRGRVPLAAIACADAADAVARVAALDLDGFRPFLLAVLDARGDRRLVRWSGREIEAGAPLPPTRPVVSSSFCTHDVRSSREALFARMGQPTRAAHLAYHRSHDPARGPYSVCMHRPDARTVSFSHVRVGRVRIELAYVPGPPCRGEGAQDPLTLARAV